MFTTLKPGRNLDERQQAERNVRSTVEEIIEKVRNQGDAAVRELSVGFDQWDRESYRLRTSEIEQLLDSVPKTVIRDIEFAQKRVAPSPGTRRALTDIEIETVPGVRLGHRTFSPMLGVRSGRKISDGGVRPWRGDRKGGRC
jgi:sulfopropanediol 3-dehydrogenase